MCRLQRPLDTKTQIRVAVEAEAILNVIALWEAGQFELVSSQALMFEAEQITPSPRKAYGYGNYTEERESLFKDLTLNEILKRMQNT